MRGRGVGRLFVAGAVLFVVGVSSAGPASARGVDATTPDYELPFPCGQAWTGTSRAGHSPSRLSIDFNRDGDLGDLMVAAAPGVVSAVADTGDASYGRYVVVDHGDGHSSLYAHLRAVWTTQGQRVDQGTVLGVVGATGGVTGPHLHFEERFDRRDQPAVFHGSTYALGTGTVSANCPDVPLVGDWDADRIDEVAVFRRGGRTGQFRLSQDETVPAAIFFGRSSDTPVAGDWDGDGHTDVGVRRPGKRLFLLRSADGTSTSVRLGTRRDVAVTGDWNGDGTTDVGIWRPRTGVFRLRTGPGAIETVRLAGTGVDPVTGDWNGDGRADVGTFDPATATFTLQVSAADGTAWYTTVAFGSTADLPVTGDWNGDGTTDVGTWNPGTATYALRTAPATGRSTATVSTQRFGRRR